MEIELLETVIQDSTTIEVSDRVPGDARPIAAMLRGKLLSWFSSLLQNTADDALDYGKYVVSLTHCDPMQLEGSFDITVEKKKKPRVAALKKPGSYLAEMKQCYEIGDKVNITASVEVDYYETNLREYRRYPVGPKRRDQIYQVTGIVRRHVGKRHPAYSPFMGGPLDSDPVEFEHTGTLWLFELRAGLYDSRVYAFLEDLRPLEG